MNYKYVRIWKEAVMACLKGLYLYFPTGTKENHEKTQSGYLVVWPRFEMDTFQI
jgi:hypothetical protein